MSTWLDLGISLLAQQPKFERADTELHPDQVGYFFLVFSLVLFFIGLAIILVYRVMYPPEEKKSKEQAPAPVSIPGIDMQQRPTGVGLPSPDYAVSQQTTAPAATSTASTPGFVPGAPQPDPPQKQGPHHNVLLAINGQQAGPYTRDQVIEMVAMGKIASTTLCWTPGKADWEPASRL